MNGYRLQKPAIKAFNIVRKKNKRSWVGILISISPQTPSGPKKMSNKENKTSKI